LLLYIPFFNTKAFQKNNKETWKEGYDVNINDVSNVSKIFNYQIVTTVQEDCDEEWDRLQEITNKLETNKNFNTWNDVKTDTMDFCTNTKNIEKYDLA